jgi:release factor glutamine methyltransferase
MLFNPPYVPTPPEEMQGDGISISWAGGERGREVLDRLIAQIPALLSPKGVLYLVVLEENDPGELARVFEAAGLSSELVHKIKARNEKLAIYK